MESKEQINSKLQFLKKSSFPTIIFGISGSVASIKAKEIAEGLIS